MCAQQSYAIAYLKEIVEIPECANKVIHFSSSYEFRASKLNKYIEKFYERGTSTLKSNFIFWIKWTITVRQHCTKEEYFGVIDNDVAWTRKKVATSTGSMSHSRQRSKRLFT